MSATWSVKNVHLDTARAPIGKRAVGQRYGGKHPRTITRWVHQGVIPAPDLSINNRDYWYEDSLEQHDRQLVAEACRKRQTSELVNLRTRAGPKNRPARQD